MLKHLLLLFLLPALAVSGCSSDTGQVVETTKMTIAENPVSNQSEPQEDTDQLHREFEEFERSQSENQTQKESIISETEQRTELKNEAPPKPKCPSTCGDGNPCTRDFCSSETSYNCQHSPITPCCGNSKCEEKETYPSCPLDCEKPECTFQCEPCHSLNKETCSCSAITECKPLDECCPQTCSSQTDSDCPVLDSCSSDSDCDDSNPCTKDSCSGQPKNCSFSPVTECVPDGCCPENCSSQTDSDCPHQSLVFSEIYYDPKSTDDKHEWIEIYNNGSVSVDLTEWRFEDNGKQHFLKNTTNEKEIKPGTYAVIADDSDMFLIDNPEFPGLLFGSYFYSGLSNTGELLILRMGKDGEISDSILYNSTWGGNGTGFSLEKIDISGLNTQENWNQSLAEKGTPGQKNSIS